MSDDKPLVYEEDGLIIYRASGFMSCPKALVAARQGYEGLPPPKKTQELFDAGHEAEEEALKVLIDKYLIVGRQGSVQLPLTHRIVIKGHIDALSSDSLTTIVEVKSQSSAAWDDFEKKGWESGYFPKYKWQVSAYMLALDMPLRLVRFNRDTEEVEEEVIQTPFYSLDQIREKVLLVEAAARSGDLPSECVDRMYPCPFYYLHEDEQVERSEEEGLEILAATYHKNLAEEKKAKGRKETARLALRESLGLGKTDVGEWRVNFYKQKNPARLDWERVEEAGIDLSPYMEQTEGERVRVSRRDNAGPEGGE